MMAKGSVQGALYEALQRRGRNLILFPKRVSPILLALFQAGALCFFLSLLDETGTPPGRTLRASPTVLPESEQETLLSQVLDAFQSAPVRWNEIVTAVILAICAGLCISAGSGGGGLYVPIFIAMLQMPVHTATSASQILIFGSSLAGVSYDVFQRHPERERPLVDLSVILFLAPLMMAGALVGSVISATLPPSLVMLMLVIACSAAAYKSLRKGVRLWQTENQMDMDVMDTMEPIDPLAFITCASNDAVKENGGTGTGGTPTPSSNSSRKYSFADRPELLKFDNYHDHVTPGPIKKSLSNKKCGSDGAEKGMANGDTKEAVAPASVARNPGKGQSIDHKTPTICAQEAQNQEQFLKLGQLTETDDFRVHSTDMIYYKKLRDYRKKKRSKLSKHSPRPFEVMGIHRISFWNPKCNCVFSTFRDQDFIYVFQFLSEKELFSCRAVCLRWHFLSHAKALQDRFGNLKRTVSYSIIWNPETPSQKPWKPSSLKNIKEEPLMLGPSHATQINDGSDTETETSLYCTPCDTSSSNGQPQQRSLLSVPSPWVGHGKNSMGKKQASKVGRGIFMNSSAAAPLARSNGGSKKGGYGYGSITRQEEVNSIMGPDIEVLLPTTKKGAVSCLLSKQQQMITEAREKSRQLIKQEQTISPTQAIKLLLIWLITFGLIVVRGGKGTKSVLNVAYCGSTYWAVTGSAIILLAGVALFAGKDLYDLHKLKIACHYPFAKGDPHWTVGYLRSMSMITFCTGIAAGVLGVGGGMFLSPVLFEMGMLPLVVAAISTTCILLSSSVLSVLIIVQGTVSMSTVALYFFGTVFGAFSGKFFVKKIVARYRSSAIIPLILGGVIIASMFVATSQNVNKFVGQLESGHIEGFRGVCEAAK